MSSENEMETRENIPLKLGRRKNFCDEDFLSGTKFINVAFATLTAIITVALLLQIYYGDYQVVPHGSVATDSLDCSKIGTEVLKNGGGAADAAIAAVFCLAVVAPHLTSLDADAQLMLYNHRKRSPPEVFLCGKFEFDTALPPLPNLVTCMAYLHKKYGTKPWKGLVKPSIEVAKRGFLLSKMVVQAVKQAKVEDLYGRLEPGQLLQLEVLGDTLEEISNIPETNLYEYLTADNTPTTSGAVKMTFTNFDIYTTPGPTTGPLLLANLEQLQAYNLTSKTEYVYTMAALTHALYLSQNVSAIYHQGVSTNLAVMDLNDNYVSLGMGLYDFFGSGEMTTRGYILDQKSDTQCSYLSFIMVDGRAICGRRLVLGANDVAVATQLITNILVARDNVSVAMEAPRFHISANGSLSFEHSHSPLFDEDLLKHLETLTDGTVLVREPYLSSNVIEKVKDDLNSHSDSRGGGIASRF